MRSTHPLLSSDALLDVLAVNAGEKYLVYRRRNTEDGIIIALNFSGEAKNLVIGKMPEEMVEVFTKEKVHFSNKGGFILLPWAFSVWINQSA